MNIKLKLIEALHPINVRLDELKLGWSYILRMVIRAEDKDGFISDVVIHYGNGDSMVATTQEIIDVMRDRFYREPIENAKALTIVTDLGGAYGTFTVNVIP